MIHVRTLRPGPYDNGGVERALELRKVKRYFLQAPVHFTWKDPDGNSRVGQGMTRDISMQAVFVVAPDCPSAGNRMRVDVQLPSLRGTPGVLLRGEGVVLRVDRDQSRISGFVVATRLHSTARGTPNPLLNWDENLGSVQ